MTDTREQFEAHFALTARQLKRDNYGDYVDPYVQHRWVGYQAGRIVPEGWKLVPIEPTEEMDAAARAECHRVRGCIDPVIHIWDVMLEAAPK